MQTMTVEVNSSSALKVLRSLNQKKEIRIVEETIPQSPSLPGKALSLSAFEDWIKTAEGAHSVTLQEAKKLWAEKRKNLQKAIR